MGVLGAKLTGYALYCLAALIFFLWLFFPATYLEQWPERYITARFPTLALTLEGLDYHFPGTLACHHLALYDRQSGAALLELNQVNLVLHLSQIFGSIRGSAEYSADLYTGKIYGHLTKDEGVVQADARLEGLAVEYMDGLVLALNRKIEGTASGQMAIRLDAAMEKLLSLTGSLRVDQGRVEVQGVLLRHTPLQFDELQCMVQGKDDRFHIEAGYLRSGTFDADFTGEVQLAQSIGQTGLSLKGTLVPKEQFFAAMNNPSLKKILHDRIQKEPLHFYLSGSASKPHISLDAYALLSDKLTSY